MLNREHLHNQWLNCTENFAIDYFTKKYGEGKEQSFLITSISSQKVCIDFKVHKKILLPKGSSAIIMKMARFSQCRFWPDIVSGMDGEKIPKTTFCLKSLLLASYPRDVENGCFKAHDGAAIIGDEDISLNHAYAKHVAFSGLGIILLRETRTFFDCFLDDNEVVRRANEHFLAIKGA